jgi:hypothetical protein
MSNIQAQIDALNTSVVVLNNTLSNITGNTLSNYNLLTRIVSQQSNINNAVYNGTGNLFTGNMIVNSNANITGNLFVNGGTLFVDSLNNRVGINNPNPQYNMDIKGNANISVNAFIRNNLAIGSTSASANLNVVGNAIIAGNLNVDNGALWVDAVNNRVGILNTNPLVDFDLKGNANISGNASFQSDANIAGNILTNGFNNSYFTVNNTNITYTLPSFLRRITFVQRQTLSTATSSTAYNSLKIVFTGNNSIVLFARIVGNLYYSDTTSSGIFQENRILIDTNNTPADTSVSSISNGTPITISKGTASTWTSCNMSTDLTIAREALIRITPVFTGSESTDASAITIDWFMTITTNASGTSISSLQFYAGV